MARPSFAFDPNLLGPFTAVAEAGSILGASRALNLSQPAVTAQMRRLEAQLGVALFRRSNSGAALTPAGTRLFERSRAVFTAVSGAAHGLAEGARAKGHLTLFASDTTGSHVLPRLFAPFHARHPGVTLKLRVGNTEAAQRALMRGEADLGLVEGVAKSGAARLETYMDDELVLAASARHPRQSVTLKDLARETLIWREQGSGTRDVVERALVRAGLPRAALKAGFEMESTAAIKHAVAGGLGLAFLSRWALQAELLQGGLKVLPLERMSIRRSFQWVLASGALEPAAALFLEFARRHPPDYGT